MEWKGCENRKRNIAFEARIFNNNFAMFIFVCVLRLVKDIFILSSDTATNFDNLPRQPEPVSSSVIFRVLWSEERNSILTQIRICHFRQMEIFLWNQSVKSQWLSLWETVREITLKCLMEEPDLWMCSEIKNRLFLLRLKKKNESSQVDSIRRIQRWNQVRK